MSAGVTVQSPAKRQLIHFIQTGELDVDYSFYLAGDIKRAQAFVQQMRVELSRFRKIVMAKGQVPRDFKVLLISIEVISPEDGPEKCKVTLRQSMTGHAKVTESLGDVLDMIARPAKTSKPQE